MSREIKFRVWSTDKQQMTYLEDGYVSEALYHYKEYGYPLMQFTGLHDKNGKEIYESDKLKDLDGNIGVVEFDSGSFIIRHKNGTSDFIATKNYFELTGNIYES